jgi:hypothetical protein
VFVGAACRVRTETRHETTPVFRSRTRRRLEDTLLLGHPQGPTGARLLIELIEELVLLGGGYGMFNGCAAALIVKVDS